MSEVSRGRQKRCIWIPTELAQRLNVVARRINISVAATNGIRAMVSAAEQDPNFAMPCKTYAKCNRGHTLHDDNVTVIDGARFCASCAEKGRRFPA